MGYRVAEFANLTGVTVRALQYYDRLGLLRPSRTESGHRVYAESDQARVRHILALRAVGMSLQQIRDALDAPASRLAELFQVQRARLERSRTGIEEALGALQQVEAAFGNAGPGPLDRLASAVEMQDVLESMRTYFTDEAWTKWGRHYFHDWPSAAWRAAFRDIEAALDEDPSSERAQQLLDVKGMARPGTLATTGRANCSADTRNSGLRRSRGSWERPAWSRGAVAASSTPTRPAAGRRPSV